MKHPISFFMMKTTGVPLELLFFKRRTFYEDKYVQKRRIKGGALLVSNHKSIFDYMMYFFLFFFRKIYCLVAEVMYRNAFFRFCLNTIGGIRVDRSDPNIIGFVNKSVELIKKGKLVLSFPESRLIHDKELGVFYPSYILIALKANAPIIPIYTDGRYGLFKRSSVIIGKPINLRDRCHNENPSAQEINALNDLVKDKIQELKETLERRKRNHLFSFKKILMDFGRFLVYTTLGLLFRVKIHKNPSNPNLNRIQGHAIVVANHNSFMDPLVLLCAYWRRRCRCLMADVVVKGHKLRGFLLNQLGCIKINRDALDVESISKCSKALNNDQILIMFPEGKINRDSLAGSFKAGTAMLSIKTKAPIIPCYVKPRKHWYNRSHVYFGDMIKADRKNTSLKMMNELTEKIRNSIIDLEEMAEKEGK